MGLTVAMIGLDSHLLFAFTPDHSAVPHFTLDSVQAGGPPGGDPSQEFAFHLDMIPRVDPGVNHRYLEACYVPGCAAPAWPSRASARPTSIPSSGR